MPIPVSQAHDVLLGYLLRRFPERIEEWQPLQPIADALVRFFVSRQTPGFVFNPHPPPIPDALVRAIRSLERREYVQYDAEQREIKLTSVGAFIALMHDLPEELLSEIETSIA